MAADDVGRPLARRAFPTDTGGGLIFAGAGWFMGVSLVETGGVSPVRLTVFDGTSNAGQIIDVLACGANGSDHTAHDTLPVRIERGLFVQGAGAGFGTVIVYGVASFDLIHLGDPFAPDIVGNIDY